MSRLPAVVFALLAAATVGAFFVVQHLKVSDPILGGFPAPLPAVINPRSGAVCSGVDHRQMKISFYLYRSDDVDVYVIDPAGTVVATIGSGRHMDRRVRTYFTWDGRDDSGRFVADGSYFVQVSLIHQGRTVVIAPTSGGPPTPVRVETHPPAPVVAGVSPPIVPVGRSGRVGFRLTGTEGHLVTVRVFRTDLPGTPRVVAQYVTGGGAGAASWNGRVGHRPAPAGTYLVGAEVTDAACNTGRFPRTLPPAPGTTRGAGVTVRYIAAEPPLAPVAAGDPATVFVDARRRPYTWALRAAASTRALSSGGVPVNSVSLSVPLPGSGPGLYELSVRTADHRTVVPLVGRGPAAPLLVVLPALTWQGRNPVDDDGDGVPNTLDERVPVRLARPLARGLPAGWGAEVALVRYIAATRRHFELTTDLALAEGVGPALTGHRGVLIAGDVQWVPESVAAGLRRYVRGGGRVVSIGLTTLRSTVRISGGVARVVSGLSPVDVFGLRHGGPVARDRGLASVVSDGLGLLGGTAGVFAGLGAPGYEPVTGAVAPAELATEVATTPSSAMVAGARLGSGWVAEVALRGFTTRLAGARDERAILDALLSDLTAGG